MIKMTHAFKLYLIGLALLWLADDVHATNYEQEHDGDDQPQPHSTINETTIVTTNSTRTSSPFIASNLNNGHASASSLCATANFASLPSVPLGKSPISMRTLVQGDQVCIQFDLQEPNAGWFGVGFTRDQSMVSSPPATVLVFQRSQQKPLVNVIQGYDQSDTTVVPDQSVIATQAVVSTSTALGFTYERSLAGKTPTEVAIDVSKPSTLIWAYGSSWPIRGHKSGTYGIASYNFATGTSTNLGTGQLCDSNNCSVIFGGGAFVIMLLGGLVVTCTQQRLGVSHWLLHLSLMSPPTKRMTNALIQWNPVTLLAQTLSDLYFGELAIVVIFIAALVALAVASPNDSTTSITGKLAVTCMMFLFLPVARVPMVWQKVFGSSFERMVKFHRWLGMLSIVIVLVHLLVAIGDADAFDRDQNGQAVPFWGTLAFICFAAMGLLSSGPIRRVAFEVFYYSHRILLIAGTVFALLHTDYIIWAMIFSLVVYGISVAWRWLRCCKYLRMEATLQMVVTDTTTSVVLKPTTKTKWLATHMDACSYFWVNFSSVSMLEWHPFSAIVTPQQDSIGFVIKSMGAGSFSDKLVQYAHTNSQTKVTLCGPFGRIGVNLDDYEVVILVAGGVGITPLLSLLNQYARYQDGNETTDSVVSHVKEFRVIWSVRDPEDLLMVDKFVPSGALGGEGVGAAQQQEMPHQSSQTPRVYWRCQVSRAKAPVSINGQQQWSVRRPNGEEIFYSPGRPILDEVINTSRFGSVDHHGIAVLACGPPTLVAEAQELARACRFDFHKEIFSW